MPAATYSCGDTCLPVWPTWLLCGYQPASTAARLAPTAAPSESANSSTGLKSPPVPRPPETTIAASVSSGRPVAFLGCESVIRAARAVSLRVTSKASTAPAAGDASSGTEFGLTAMIEVPVVTVGGHGVRAGEDRLGGLDAVVAAAHVDGIGDQARAGLDGEPGGDLLAGGVARDEHGRRGDLRDQRGEDLGLRRDEEGRGIGVVDDVDLVRAVLGQRHLGLLGTDADVHGGGLAEAAGDRQQLGGRLAQPPVGVVDENEYFSHGFSVLPVSRRSLR